MVRWFGKHFGAGGWSWCCVGEQLQADGKAAPDPMGEPVTEQAVIKEDAGASKVGL